MILVIKKIFLIHTEICLHRLFFIVFLRILFMNALKIIECIYLKSLYCRQNKSKSNNKLNVFFSFIYSQQQQSGNHLQSHLLFDNKTRQE